MLDRSELEEENKLVASWWFRIHLGWGEMGELNVEEQRITWRKFRRAVHISSESSCTIPLSGGSFLGLCMNLRVGTVAARKL